MDRREAHVATGPLAYGEAAADLSVLILTHNEEKNIDKCLTSVRPLTDRIYIVDSGSNDRTVELARAFGAQVAQRAWTTYADQFNWGLDHFAFQTGWILRLDADEELTPSLVKALRGFLRAAPADVSGVYLRRRVFFWGRWIRHGGYYPTWLLRVFRRGAGRCEAVWMDEHIVLGHGKTASLRADLIDHNNKDLTFWTDKHNRYASREVLDLLARSQSSAPADRLEPSLAGSQPHSRRWMKDRIYGRLPLFWRAFAYFIYRYVLRLGFLDGREGLVFHFLQGCWYRFLVDAKLHEHRRKPRTAESRKAVAVP
ncbi:MAG: glycosyltransferase family 2 protein [Nevskiales bacterium]|nr:glycosyltransferase family 2 protein [Nevskiales bacterium]